jgi:hypothetical protein
MFAAANTASTPSGERGPNNTKQIGAAAAQITAATNAAASKPAA